MDEGQETARREPKRHCSNVHNLFFSYLANQFAVQNAGISVRNDAELHNVDQSIVEERV